MTKVFSEEHRRHLSESHRGKHSAMYGKHHTAEARARMAASHTGKKHSDETKAKMAAKRTEYWKKQKEIKEND